MSEDINKDASGAEALAPDADQNFLVVGLGASAGGVQALRDFFARVPAESGMAYVVILHLSPDHDSQLASVLQNTALIPVTQVEDHVRVEPNHVYVIPPNKSLAINDGRLDIFNMTSTEVRRAPVDIFFRTLAESHGARAVSVVLSGTGANGSMGMKRVKEMGGLCIVQDPEEAEYPDMPRHSLATGLVDYVLPVAEMPAQIIAYREQLKLIRVPDPPAEPTEADANALRDIFTQLRVRTGHDFSNYKRPTVLRRIARRIGVLELSDLTAYAQFMHEHPAEATALLKDLLISVTHFFRDAEAFAALERAIIPKLFEGKRPDDQVRVWVAGCATGEEAYTVAMMLSDYAATLSSPPQIQVFATDIDEAAIAAARDGFYTINDAADVPSDLLSRYFVGEVGDGYRVRREIRERVLFAVHNIIKDPPFAHLDLATCRNFLIYLNRTAQRLVLDVLHFALNPGGYLMLGSSESVDGAGDLFSVVDKEHRIYRGRAVETRMIFPVPDGSLAARLGKLPEIQRVREAQPAQRSTYAQLHQRLLEHYAPPSVVVNEDYDILHMSESAGSFMQIKGGEPSTNLLMLVRPELSLELRAALYQAAQKKMEVESRGVSVTVGDETKTINVRVRPVLSEEDRARGFFLVLFEAASEQAQEVARQETIVATDDEPLARRLEEELLEVRAQLSATIEQHETQREELKAANEELQAMNEETRAAAEELETSKEELQSINEELTTVNQELKIKIDELGHANDDLRNLMNSTQIGTVFLDRELRVKLFTPRARDIFNFIPADIGRELSDITSKLDDDRLIADAKQVLERLQPVERAMQTKDGRTFLMQISPYRTNEDRINGVVVAFLDITERHRTEQSLRQSEEQFRQAIEDAPIPVIMHAEDGEVLQVSRTWTELTGYTTEDVPTFEAWLKRACGDGADEVRNQMHGLFKGDLHTLNIEFPIRTREGSLRHWSLSAASPGTLSDGRRFIVGMAVDITERKRMEETLRRSNERVRLMMESVEDYAIFTLDAGGRIESWNAGAKRIFGYTEAEAIDQSGAIIFTPEDRAKGAPAQEMKTARDMGRAADERWHLRKNGTRLYVSGALYALRDDGGALTGYVKIARDLTERMRAEEELRRAHDELEVRVRERTFQLAKLNESLRGEISERIQTERERVRLLRQIVRAQEDERRRIARDIHDQLGQQMTALRLNLAALDGRCGEDEEMRRKLEQAQTIAERLDADVDFLAWELRPAALDDIGLAEAIANYVRQWSKHAGVEAEFHTAGMDKERLSPETETNLYRITQEALNNTMKYAQARRVDVLLERRDNQVVLIIEDDGVGFNLKKAAGAAGDKGMGLIGMRERAVLVGGTLEIESKPKEGTTIFARVPFKFSEEEAGAAS
jgi:two-component system, chemotaxis family, CheB/CheR fusion protein